MPAGYQPAPPAKGRRYTGSMSIACRSVIIGKRLQKHALSVGNELTFLRFVTAIPTRLLSTSNAMESGNNVIYDRRGLSESHEVRGCNLTVSEITERWSQIVINLACNAGTRGFDMSFTVNRGCPPAA